MAPLDTPIASKSESKSDKPKWDVNKPPGDAATVNIDTRTGTWMSVDVRPDGKQLVFDLLGDLYTLPIEGGDATPLTHSIAWDMQARYSPDGKRIAFMSDAGGGDNVWVMNADGSNARAVTKESFRLLNNPVWHPSGQYIAARKHYSGTRSLGSGEIWLYHESGADEGGGVQLNEKPNWQKDLGEPAYSPDGRYLYYSQDTTPGDSFQYNKDGNGQIYQIFRRDIKEGKTRAFVSGPGGAVRPTPSPDGHWLAFVRRVRMQSTLFIKDLKSGEERPIWGELERDLQESWAVHGVYPAFAWLPDNKGVVVWAKGKLWKVSFNPADRASKAVASEIPFRVKHTREVRKAIQSPTAVAPERFDVRQLRWVNVSPSVDRVVYSALGYLYSVPLKNGLPAGTPTRLTQQRTHFEYYPQFSRDGLRVVFVTWNDQSLGSVRTLNLATGKETVLTNALGKYLDPAFSPDGRNVVFRKASGGFLTTPWHGLDTGLYIADSEARTAPKLITERIDDAQFGKDNDVLYLTRPTTTNEVDLLNQLVRFDLNTRDEQVIAKSEFASDFAVSPDGQWLAFTERFQTYVTPLPQAGRTVTLGKKMNALPVRQLSKNAGDYLHWSGDSKALHFTMGSELFTAPLQQNFKFVDGAPSELPKPSENGINIGFQHVADVPSATTVLDGARIVTMRGDEVIDMGRIIVKGNRLVAVAPLTGPGAVTIPSGATVIDVRGKTIIPGLVDAHWHGGMGEQGLLPQQSWINFASLAFGVTTLHDPSNDTATIFTQAEMQRAGHIVAPRTYSTGSVLYGAKSRTTAEVTSLDDALTHLKRMRAAGAVSIKSYNQPRRDQRQQLLEAARQTGLLVMPEGGALFQHNMTMIIDGHTGVEHALPIAHVYDDVQQLWTQTKVAYTPTFNVAYGGLDGEHYWYARTDVWKHPLLTKYVPRSVLEPRSIRRLNAPEEDFNSLTVAATATKLQRAGVPVQIGAHGQREGLGAHWEMWILMKGGMTPLEAIRAGTLNGAKYIGMDKDIGSLEVGKLADLVVIDADILNEPYKTDRVVSVMLNGRLYDSATMNEIGATPKARKPLFFDGAQGIGMPVVSKGHAHGEEDANDFSYGRHHHGD
jgi:imidazolonepropionase-like amidohydrolase/Tol biopolymer transport system component